MENRDVRSQLDFNVEVDIWSSGRQVQSLCRSVIAPSHPKIKTLMHPLNNSGDTVNLLPAEIWLMQCYIYLHVRPFYVALASF